MTGNLEQLILVSSGSYVCGNTHLENIVFTPDLPEGVTHQYKAVMYINAGLVAIHAEFLLSSPCIIDNIICDLPVNAFQPVSLFPSDEPPFAIMFNSNVYTQNLEVDKVHTVTEHDNGYAILYYDESYNKKLKFKINHILAFNKLLVTLYYFHPRSLM